MQVKVCDLCGVKIKKLPYEDMIFNLKFEFSNGAGVTHIDIEDICKDCTAPIARALGLRK